MNCFGYCFAFLAVFLRAFRCFFLRFGVTVMNDELKSLFAAGGLERFSTAVSSTLSSVRLGGP